jgi:hypothetical protein
MSRRRPTRPSVAARVLIAVLAVLAVVAAGCDAMIAPPSPRPSREISTPEPTPRATPTEVDEFETLPPGDASPEPDDLVAAAEALSDLDSYRVTVATRGIVPATTASGTVAMTSTLIQGESPAARFAMTGADGFAGGRLEAIVIGDRAWFKEGSGSWQPSPGGAADFDAAFLTLSPVELVRTFDALTPILAKAGTERRNGIRTEHLHGDASNLAATDAGLVDGTIDMWRATNGGYLVALDLDGSWLDDDGNPVRTTLKIDVTRVDDAANRVSAP